MVHMFFMIASLFAFWIPAGEFEEDLFETHAQWTKFEQVITGLDHLFGNFRTQVLAGREFELHQAISLEFDAAHAFDLLDGRGKFLVCLTTNTHYDTLRAHQACL